MSVVFHGREFWLSCEHPVSQHNWVRVVQQVGKQASLCHEPSGGLGNRPDPFRTHLYQCTSWHCCERLYTASVHFFFWDPFNTHFMTGGLWVHLLISRWVFSSFWPKTAWTLCPTLPIHPISPQQLLFICFFPWIKKKKSSKGNVLPMWKKWNKKW